MERENRLSSILASLELAVSDGVNRTVNKYNFYDNFDLEVPANNEVIYGSKRRILTEYDIQKFLEKISDEDIHEISSDGKTLIATGYEFIWGKKVPEKISKHKDIILSKANEGKKLSDLETLLVIVSRLDTDNLF